MSGSSPNKHDFRNVAQSLPEAKKPHSDKTSQELADNSLLHDAIYYST